MCAARQSRNQNEHLTMETRRKARSNSQKIKSQNLNTEDTEELSEGAES
jgi:hypothetical protein